MAGPRSAGDGFDIVERMKAKRTDALPPRSKVAELLAFLPGFSAPGRVFVLDGPLPTPDGPGIDTILHPGYPSDVFAFFMTIGTEPWMDSDYRSLRPERFVADPALIVHATWPEVRALLNHCARAERFCDGYWSTVLRKGVVQEALRRLDSLCDEEGAA